jgi:hypothetical protein
MAAEEREASEAYRPFTVPAGAPSARSVQS